MASTLEVWMLALLNTRPQLISKQVLTSSAATVTFSSIPQQFTNLRLVISAKSDNTGGGGFDPVTVQFNNVTTASYNWNSYWATQGGSSVSVSNGSGVTSAQCAQVWSNHFTTPGRGITTIDIPNYSDGNNIKAFTSISAATDGGTSGILQTYTGSLGGGTTAITAITLLASTGNFVTDSTFCLYGE